jgi:predicted RNA-binding protein with RPS1 domain
MPRPQSGRNRLLAVSLVALTITACSGAAEQAIINHFFIASRLRDNTSLQNFATVIFDPRTQGTVVTFDIVNVSEERRTPLSLKALMQAHEDAKAEDAAYSKRKQEYLDQNIEAIRRVLKAENENATVKGKDAEVQATWLKLREEGAQVAKKVTDARSKLAAQASIVELSVLGLATPTELKQYDGEFAIKDVTVSAPVRQPSGQTAQKTLIITMQRAHLKGQSDLTGRWIITSVKDQTTQAAEKTS